MNYQQCLKHQHSSRIFTLHTSTTRYKSFKVMAIYSFWIFDRHCNCIYSREWTQVLNPATDSSAQSGTINSKSNEDNAKLLFGALFSLRSIAEKLGDTPEARNSMSSFSTAKYRAHFYESASALRFCIISDIQTMNLQDVLKTIYSKIYVENIVKNPLSPVDFKPGAKITNQRFIRAVDNYLGEK